MPQDEIYEIRWHARGGQGAKTAATLLAEVAISEGRYSQGFPDYGPERMGAPMRGYTRISDGEIRIHSAVYYPDAVVVLDDTLLTSVDVCENLKKDGVVIVNTSSPAEKILPLLKKDGQPVYLVDATRIARDEIGRPIPNIPALGTLVKATEAVKPDTVEADIRHKFGKKFPERVIEGNVRAFKRGIEEAEKV